MDLASAQSRIFSSADLLGYFGREQGHAIKLSENYLALLAKLGDPHKKLPPVFHVAGTNGKGSVCAFLRAILEAAGYRVHVYTSPHLVRFHERIRIAGKLIDEAELVEILGTIKGFSPPGAITYFEAATAAAFAVFVRHPADFTILEVGMGGRLDATNVIEKPLATIITRLSYDHCQYLGDTLAQIAREKAGIMKQGAPCFIAKQPDREGVESLRKCSAEKNVVPKLGGEDWHIMPNENGFHFSDATREIDLPRPALLGDHQFENSGLAIAALSVLPQEIPANAIARGLQTVEWPARLQRISEGALADLLSPQNELWLDGGHNDSAGEALAMQARKWAENAAKRPFCLVFGMLATKDPRAFLKPLAPYVEKLVTVAIPDEPNSFSAEDLAARAREAGITNATAAPNITQAIKNLAAKAPGKILICGSLYLAGHVLRLTDGKNSGR